VSVQLQEKIMAQSNQQYQATQSQSSKDGESSQTKSATASPPGPTSPSPDKCPASPSPSSAFKVPHNPEPKYDGLPADKKAALETLFVEKKDEAQEEMKQAEVAAANAQQEAQSAYDIAKKKDESTKEVRDLKIKNKKKKIWSEYLQCLRALVPKGQIPDKDKDIEDDPLIPAHKKAICIAQLNQKLAEVELEYLNDCLKSREEFAAATNNLQSANDQYEANLWRASKAEILAEQTAQVEWKQAISDALVEIGQ
jgi:hypothetical protein